MHAVARGDTYVCAQVSKFFVADYLRPTRDPARHGANHRGAPRLLTARQWEVLALIAEGNTTREIALRLGLGPRTVETHRTRLMHRLDIHTIAGLVRYALQLGLSALSA